MQWRAVILRIGEATMQYSGGRKYCMLLYPYGMIVLYRTAGSPPLYCKIALHCTLHPLKSNIFVADHLVCFGGKSGQAFTSNMACLSVSI